MGGTEAEKYEVLEKIGTYTVFDINSRFALTIEQVKVALASFAKYVGRPMATYVEHHHVAARR